MAKKTVKRTTSAPATRDRSRSPQTSLPIELPEPKLRGGRSLPESLRRRKTTREISHKKLPLQVVSNLLWAACGVNRRQGPFGTPGITAASASNSQEIDLFVAMEDGVFVYDARHHKLVPVVAGDLRSMAIGRGQKDMAANAPIQLIYVVDIHRLSHTSGFQEPGLQDPEVQKSYYYVDTGLIAGNVYLFAASQGLASWFHNCDRIGLGKNLKLRAEQRVLFGQTVGYPERT
jgi:nitroreductase